MYKISLGARVRDRVMFEENGRNIRLTVSGDAFKMVDALNEAKVQMTGVDSASDEQVRQRAALAFATAIFGHAQAKRLLDFYEGDSASVVAACGKYFRERLARKIADVQKRAG